MVEKPKNAYLNVQQMIKDIYKDDVKLMYEVINELDEHVRYGQDPYDLSDLYTSLEDYIEGIHVKICVILDYYELKTIKEQYINEYNKMSKIKLKLYLESDVVDSPIYIMMNKYLAALKYIEIPSNNPSIINNYNQLISEISNKNITKNEASKKIIEKLEEIEFKNEEKEKQYRDLIEELKSNPKDKKVILTKIKEFIISTGTDFVKDEIKDQVPNIIDLLYKFW